MKFSVAFEGSIYGSGDASSFEEHLDGLMESLLELGAEDPAISGAAAEGAVEISVSVEAPSVDEALAKAGSIIRSAILKAGEFTADWSSASARRTNLIQA